MNDILKRKRGRPKGTTKGDEVLSFSNEELDRFLKEANKDKLARLQFGLTLFMGLRVSELVALKVADVDLTGPLVSVVVQGVKKGIKKPYDLPPGLSRQLRQYVKSLPKNRIWLFQGRWPETHVARITIQLLFNKLRDQAGLNKKYSIHSLRHTSAMRKIRAGASPVMVQNWLRQKTLEAAVNYFRCGKNKEYNALVIEQDSELFL